MELHNPALVALLGGTALATLLALLAVLSRKGRTEDTARAYLAGFTYVLSDDPDAAIAELSKAAQLNTETLETYFALGALFRRKGELDRAIRLHRNILLRPGLAPEVRSQAQLELALDYKRSALNDKAVETFEKLLAGDPSNPEALLHYRRVLESAREWQRAVEIQLRLIDSDRNGQAILAHLLAESARSRLQSAPTESLSAAVRAVELQPDSADAQLALGESMMALGRGAEADAPLRRSMKLEPELAPKATRLCAIACVDPKSLEGFLREQIARHPREVAPFQLSIALLLRETGRADPALEQLRHLVERNPRFWEARKELGNLLLAQGRAEELREDYRDILTTLGEPALAFICKSCRQRLPEHVFRCPACEEWDTVRRDDGDRLSPLI
jgi:lipopolysaccharide biosynthesis regulator YciM